MLIIIEAKISLQRCLLAEETMNMKSQQLEI